MYLETYLYLELLYTEKSVTNFNIIITIFYLDHVQTLVTVI